MRLNQIVRGGWRRGQNLRTPTETGTAGAALGRRGARIASSALNLTLLAFFAVCFLLQCSLPDYGGERHVAGISSPVEIVRDAWAVPHIHGDSDRDVFFALGYVHAQDRLWQMELNRRAPQGRLAELFGSRALFFDTLMRTLDVYGHAQRAVHRQSPETRAVLEAYADGVNAHIETVRGGMPGEAGPEFLVFGSEIDPWTPADSLAVVKAMALLLSNGARIETRRARFALAAGAKKAADLFPNHPDPGFVALPEYAALFPGAPFPEKLPPGAPPPRVPPPGAGSPGTPPPGTGLPEAARAEMRLSWLAPLLPDPVPELAGASNAWAVDGGHSVSGAPLLASDPHLRLSTPCLWMLARLDVAGRSVIGGTIPGIPAIILGRNADIAWGLTSAYADNQDVFIERVNPENPEQYLTPHGWREFRERRTEIAVRGQAPVPLRIRETRHGPVVSPDHFGTGAVTPKGHVAALRWTALSADDRSLDMILGMMRATSIEEAVRFRGFLLAPVQNVVIADRDGVGMFTAGRIPLRNPASPTRGRLPSPGWTGENDWVGWMDPEETPQAIRPAGGVVANANNPTTNAAYPAHVSFDWAYPYRIRRIVQVLNAHRRHTPESFRILQNDVVSEMTREILPLLLPPLRKPGTIDPSLFDAPQRREALDRLIAWGGAMHADAPEPLLFAAWMRALTARLVSGKIGGLEKDYRGPRPLFLARVLRNIDGAAAWCDDAGTPQTENCAETSWQALGDALAELSARYGPRMESWQWGEAHQAVQAHTPFDAVPGLRSMFSVRSRTGGDAFTVMRGATRGTGDRPYVNVHGGGFRAVYDFSDLDRSVYIQSTGQSGHALSRFYDDLSKLWSIGGYIPMSLEPQQARAKSVGVMVLKPTAKR